MLLRGAVAWRETSQEQPREQVGCCMYGGPRFAEWALLLAAAAAAGRAGLHVGRGVQVAWRGLESAR